MSGKPKTFSKKHHKYDMTINLYFCPDCGTGIYKDTDADMFKDTVLVQAGTTADGLDGYTPNTELWLKEKAKWMPEVQGAAQVQEFS